MTKISKALADYEPFYERILKTGSRVICDPPPENTDDDYLILIRPDQRELLETRLQQDGWVLGGSLPNGGISNGDWTLNITHEFVGGRIDHSRVFHSWKRAEIYSPPTENSPFGSLGVSSGPEINLLVTCNEQYFDDFTRATFLCQGLNLTDKADRVTVFEALTRDVWPSGRKKKRNLLYDNERLRTLATTFTQTNEILGQMVNPPIVAHNDLMQFGVQWFDGNGNPIPATQHAAPAVEPVANW